MTTTSAPSSAPAPGPASGRASGPGPAPAPARSATVGQTARRSVPWIVLGVIALVIAGLGLLLTGGGSSSGVALDAGNAGPVGGKAVAQVLRGQGVDVRTATTLDEAQAAAGGATVLVYDPAGNLPADGYRALADAAPAVVVVEPGFRTLQEVAPDVRAAGAPEGPSAAGCSLPVARRADRIDPRPTGTTEGASVPGTFDAGGDATACFTDGGGGASLVRTTYQGADLTLVGSAALLMNDGVDRQGNAALALGVLGEHRTLVWYLPGIVDRPVTGPADLAALTPGWVTPVLLLGVVVFVAAAVWRGRRFGPLVVENLPVVVRADETREGRARLYQRSSARLRAADALRIGAVGRLARLAGLPRTATVDEVVLAVAALTGRDRQGVRGILLDDVPAGDRDLLALSDAIAALERDTAAAVSPLPPPPAGRPQPPSGRPQPPTGRMDP